MLNFNLKKINLKLFFINYLLYIFKYFKTKGFYFNIKFKLIIVFITFL